MIPALLLIEVLYSLGMKDQIRRNPIMVIDVAEIIQLLDYVIGKFNTINHCNIWIMKFHFTRILMQLFER